MDEVFYSQFGEDENLIRIFNGKTEGICIEVGANDGVNDSNSYFFEQHGWTCVLVEPNPDLCREIRKVRSALLYECAASSQPGQVTLHIAEGAERAHGVSTISNDKVVHDKIKSYGFSSRPIQVQARTLDELLDEAKIGKPIDFISIDVEGHELEVLQGFSIKKWQPRVILVEDNSNSKDHTVSNFLAILGYRKFMRTGVNDWYASNSDNELVNLKTQAKYHLMIFKMKLIDGLRKIAYATKLMPKLKRMKGQ